MLTASLTKDMSLEVNFSGLFVAWIFTLIF